MGISRERIIKLFLILFTSVFPITAQSNPEITSDLNILRTAYPDADFSSSWDPDADDWKIIVTSEDRKSILYYAEGRFVSPGQLEDKEHFRRMMYRYSPELIDPAAIPPELIERIKSFGSAENRAKAPVGGTAFFDAIYDTGTRESVEKNLVYMDFLGWEIRPHRMISDKLKRIDSQIRKLSATDKETADFIKELGHASVYNWRTVRDTSGKSFHSMAIAIDLLPENRSNRIIYWLWERNGGNDEWMLIPLKDRWMPPQSVVKIFESEGFIWGGNWSIWDNMHFEYRPELLLQSSGNAF